MIVWMHGDDSSDPEHCKYLRLTVLNGHSYSRNLRVLLLAIWAGMQLGGPETAFEAPVTSANTAEVGQSSLPPAIVRTRIHPLFGRQERVE
jgi:hypothetical protein